MLDKFSNLVKFESKVIETINDMALKKNGAFVKISFRRVLHANLRTGSKYGKSHLFLGMIQMTLISNNNSLFY